MASEQGIPDPTLAIECWRAELEGLTLFVFHENGGWGFQVHRNEKCIGEHRPCYPANDNESGAKYEATAVALDILNRSDDPVERAKSLAWSQSNSSSKRTAGA